MSRAASKSLTLSITRCGARLSGWAALVIERGEHATASRGHHREQHSRITPHAYDIPAGYFEMPPVRPAWTWRWNAMYTTSTVSIAMVRPANKPEKSDL